MDANNNTEKSDFIKRLKQATEDEDKLIQLAKEAIEESHDKRTFLERKNQDLSVNPTCINLGATIGIGHAIMNNNLSTKDKLYMIMDRYIKLALQKNHKASKDKALERFCKDFANAFPKEYGIKKAPEKLDTMQIKILKQNRVIMQ